MNVRFDDGKDEAALRTIGEVSQALDIRTHVLRYWEEQFPMLKPLKRSGGRRYYRPDDIELIKHIDRLVNREGYTLRGAKAALQAKAKRHGEVSEAPPVQTSSNRIDSALIADFKALRKRLAAALEG